MMDNWENIKTKSACSTMFLKLEKKKQIYSRWNIEFIAVCRVYPKCMYLLKTELLLIFLLPL